MIICIPYHIFTQTLLLDHKTQLCSSPWYAYTGTLYFLRTPNGTNRPPTACTNLAARVGPAVPDFPPL